MKQLIYDSVCLLLCTLASPSSLLHMMEEPFEIIQRQICSDRYDYCLMQSTNWIQPMYTFLRENV